MHLFHNLYNFIEFYVFSINFENLFLEALENSFYGKKTDV